MLWSLSLACFLIGAPVQSKPQEKPLTSRQSERAFEIKQALESGVQLETMTGLVRLRAEKHSAFAALIVHLLERGANEPVLVSAFEVAAGYDYEPLSSAIAPYLQHRQKRVRHAAAKALAKTGGPRAASAFRRALRSSDARLRGLAASALGRVGDERAVPDLFLALDRGIGAAAPSLGRLCDDAACGKLLERLGNVPFDAMGEGLVQILTRNDARVSSRTKVTTIQRLASLQTDKAKQLLQGVEGRLPDGTDLEVLDALREALSKMGKE